MGGKIWGLLICMVAGGLASPASSQASKNRTVNIQLDNPTHDAAVYSAVQNDAGENPGRWDHHYTRNHRGRCH